MHGRAIVVDGHNDLPWRLRAEFGSRLEDFDVARRHDDGHTDIPRLREGGVDVQFFAAFVPSDYVDRGAARVALEQIDLIRRLVARYAELELALDVGDVRRSVAAGKIAVLIGVEGGHTIEGSLDMLRRYRELGVRYLTLTHISSTEWADSATDEAINGGLSPFGEDVIREMNRLGMLVDISHVSDETMADVLRVSSAPVIASHSGARAVNGHARNIPDDVLRDVARNGGVVMVNFFSGFVVPEAAELVRDMFAVGREMRAQYGGDERAMEKAWRTWFAGLGVPRGNVADVVDHIEHIIDVAGVDHVGLGSDFDGISLTPEGLEDVSRFPAITEELLGRGYSAEEILKILGENLLRVLAAADEMAHR
ncbi:MAG: dipeptidase [Gemmatimonadota bacterium]|nr:MAG: dipeptidase [Gemmatimonadota bacterium]